MIEKTLIVLKPDAVERQLCGEIIQRFERVGLKIVGLKMMWINKKHAEKHYAAHSSKSFFNGLVDFITSGPVIAMVVEGIHAVSLVRKLVGDTEPFSSAPGTIRGDYSHHSYEYTDNKHIAIKNLIHASGSKEEAEKEISLWFSPDELFEYSTVHEKHVF